MKLSTHVDPFSRSTFRYAFICNLTRVDGIELIQLVDSVGSPLEDNKALNKPSVLNICSDFQKSGVTRRERAWSRKSPFL
jgi:hypothetical protein